MKKLIVIAALVLTGCGLLTPAVEQSLDEASKVILCTLEEEELNDPVLNADCEKLASVASPEHKAALARHSAKARALRGTKPVTDGGAQ